MSIKRLTILGATITALCACNNTQSASLTSGPLTTVAALENEQPADAIIGQDYYDTDTMPMISELGFGSVADITSHASTLFVADPANSRILLFKDAHTMASGGAATGIIGQTDAFHALEIDNSIKAGKMATSAEGSLYVYNSETGDVDVYLTPETSPIADYHLLDAPFPVTGMATLPNNLLAVSGTNSIQFYLRSATLTSPYHQATVESPCSGVTDLLFVDSSANGPTLLVSCQNTIWMVTLQGNTSFPKKLPYESCEGNINTIGDDVCDAGNNNQDCIWDGGDCCATTNPACASSESNTPCDCQNPDACTNITCNTPPAANCIGNSALTYENPGGCVDGECKYGKATETDCSAIGQTCANGVCLAPEDQCNIGACTSPPEQNKCEGSTATRYPTNGSCVLSENSAECNYQPITVTCSASEECNLGYCVPKISVENPADSRREIINGLHNATSLAAELSNLYVLDAGGNRVLYFEDIEEQLSQQSSTLTPQDSNKIFGQPDSDSIVTNYHNLTPGVPSDQGLSNPTGLTILENSMQLWIADGDNYRVNRYDYAENDNLANRVLGQSDFEHNQANRLILRGFLGISSVEMGYTADSPYSLIVDPISHRVVVHDNIDTFTTGNNPNEKVFGQSSITDYKANHGEAEPGADTLNTPIDAAVDPVTGKIAIADYGNQRVVVYDNKDSLSAGQALGVTNLTSVGMENLGFQRLAIRNNQLFVAVSDYSVDAQGMPNSSAHLVFHYDLEQNESNFVKPQRVFGQSYDENTQELPDNVCNRNVATSSHDTLCNIADLYLDADGSLWVVDSDNHRVLWFDSPTGESQVEATTADGIVGQRNFQENSDWDSTEENAPYRFRKPSGISLDGQGGLWVADEDSSRVLFFPTPKTKVLSSGMPKATSVIGNEMTAYGRKLMLNSATLNTPQSIAVSQTGAILLVADSANNRVLRYTHNLAPVISGGGTYTVESGSVKDVVINVTDPEGDALNPISILEDPAPSGVSLNGNTLSFSTANKAPNTSTRLHIVVSDQSPRANKSFAAITFRVISKPRVYERGEPPAERPLEVPEKSSCAAFGFPFEGLLLILLYGTRRSVLRRRPNG